MAFSPTDSRLFGHLFSDPELAEQFSDEQFVEYLIDVELALAEVQGAMGVIPQLAAQEINQVRNSLQVDFDKLQIETERAGFPVKELVRQLRQAVHSDTAMYLHWGATTQDIMDSALVLQLRGSTAILENKLKGVISNLIELIKQNRTTLMIGRTHGQQALPITFGLKAAGWLMPLARHFQRLKELEPRVFVVQYGGAAGTLAASAPSGPEVLINLAKKLNLHEALLPWHTQRDGLAEFANWLSMVSGSLAKMAQDIILLAQNEVGEIRETPDVSRGSSSTMPQKRNPVISELVIAVARSNAASLSAMHNAIIQEHERATHGLQLEWLHLPQMVALTGTALNKALYLSEHLQVNKNQMQKNVSQSKGLILAEAAEYALREHMEPADAKILVTRAVQLALVSDSHLIDELANETSIPIDWAKLKDEASYLGENELLINRVLVEAEQITKT